MAILSPEEEQKFLRWYRNWASSSKMNMNPDDPQHYYDYRGAYQSGLTPPQAGGHWPSTFKASNHPNRYVGGTDTITGNQVGYGPLLGSYSAQPNQEKPLDLFTLLSSIMSRR